MTSDRVLVVDLDGTLLRSNILFETFWSAFSIRWTTPFLAANSLMQGRAALKRCLAELSAVEAASLPYNDDVVAYIQHWRAEGGRTVLVTATNQVLAEEIAAHLGIFDEVHGSDETDNLKGVRKAAFLEQRFGNRGFTYMGDAEADLPVWGKAVKAITVNVSRPLRARVEALGGEVEHITSQASTVNPYLKALRPHQWLKNLLVFMPMLLAHQLTSETGLQSLLAFIVFGLVASSAYVVNDLLDLASDRAHSRKRNRPFAAGKLPIAHGTWLAPLLLLAGLLIALTLGGQFVLVMFVYYVATTAYSLYLKRRLVIDICTLAGLYTLRVIAGGAATGISLSVWLLAFSIFFFFALAAIKRQAELVDGVATAKADIHGRGYHVDDLPLVTNMAISSGYVSVLVMALYLNSPAVQEFYTTPLVLWGICPVLLYWLSRMVMVAHRGNMHDDPMIFAMKDRISQMCLFMILAFAIVGALL